MSQIEKLLLVSEELKKKIKSNYDKSDDAIKQDLQILYDWWGKEQHLPVVKDDDMLERILIRNKFRIEQTKKKLDAYFTLKGLYSEFFGSSWDETSKSITNAYKSAYTFPLKTPMENGERVIFFKFKGPDFVETFDCLEMFRACIMCFEVGFKYDYCDRLRCLCDLEGFSFSYYKKMDPIILYKGMKLLQEGLSCRFAGIHYFNAPTFIDLFVKIVKPLLKDGRLHVHSSLDEVKEIIPEKLMPKEYGGAAGSIDKLNDAWQKEMELHKEFLQKRISLKSDESKRIGKSQYDDMFGTDGTFKKLNLD